MVIRYNDVLTIVTTLGDAEKIQVTVKESVKGGLIAGTACALGGLVLGPAGLAVGGALGGCVAAVMSAKKFKPVSSVILHDMSPDVQQRLIAIVHDILTSLDAADAFEALTLIQGNAALKARIIGEMTRFFHREMNLNLLQR